MALTCSKRSAKSNQINLHLGKTELILQKCLIMYLINFITDISQIIKSECAVPANVNWIGLFRPDGVNGNNPRHNQSTAKKRSRFARN